MAHALWQSATPCTCSYVSFQSSSRRSPEGRASTRRDSNLSNSFRASRTSSRGHKWQRLSRVHASLTPDKPAVDNSQTTHLPEPIFADNVLKVPQDVPQQDEFQKRWQNDSASQVFRFREDAPRRRCTSRALAMGAAACVGLVGVSTGDAALAADGLLAVEPANALSLPTWAIHVASVVEWVTAMYLVWSYGDTEGKGRKAWKGLAWGMIPLLAGAMCACTWHFFYNDPSLEVIVAAQGFFTLLGNFTIWLAAYRIYQQSQLEELS